MIETNFDKLPFILKKRNWIVLSILLIISIPFMSWRLSLGILIGGLLVNINFHLLHHTLVNTLLVNKTKEGMIPKSLLRLFVIGIIISIILIKGWVSIFGLVLGLSVVVINLFLLALMETKEIIFNRR